MVRNVVENNIITKIDIPCAANTGHICAVRLRNLHSECADTSRRTIDQYFLAGLNFPFVANSLQRGDTGYVCRARLVKRDVCRFRRYEAILSNTYILRERPASAAEHFVPSFELSNILH